MRAEQAAHGDSFSEARSSLRALALGSSVAEEAGEGSRSRSSNGSIMRSCSFVGEAMAVVVVAAGVAVIAAGIATEAAAFAADVFVVEVLSSGE